MLKYGLDTNYHLTINPLLHSYLFIYHRLVKPVSQSKVNIMKALIIVKYYFAVHKHMLTSIRILIEMS